MAPHLPYCLFLVLLSAMLDAKPKKTQEVRDQMYYNFWQNFTIKQVVNEVFLDPPTQRTAWVSKLKLLQSARRTFHKEIRKLKDERSVVLAGVRTYIQAILKTQRKLDSMIPNALQNDIRLLKTQIEIMETVVKSQFNKALGLVADEDVAGYLTDTQMMVDNFVEEIEWPLDWRVDTLNDVPAQTTTVINVISEKVKNYTSLIGGFVTTTRQILNRINKNVKRWNKRLYSMAKLIRWLSKANRLYNGIDSDNHEECMQCMYQVGGGVWSEGVCDIDADDGVERCGPFWIGSESWADCPYDGKNLTAGFKPCAITKECSWKCVTGYVNLHANLGKCGNFPQPLSCENKARLWYSGPPDGCIDHEAGVEEFWSSINDCLGGNPCLDCICQAYGCEDQLGECNTVDGVERCGPLQISFKTWEECGKPGGDWKACTSSSLSCSQHCAAAYIGLHRHTCTGKTEKKQITCQEDARLWFAQSPGGCKTMTKEANDFWSEVSTCIKAKSK